MFRTSIDVIITLCKKKRYKRGVCFELLFICKEKSVQFFHICSCHYPSELLEMTYFEKQVTNSDACGSSQVSLSAKMRTLTDILNSAEDTW